MIITTHGFIKKTQKTPVKEIDRAEYIRKEYYKQKINDQMKFYTLEEITDKHIGKIGTPARYAFDAEVEAALIGARIKEARKMQNITQRELGERVGVQTAQISKIENGRNLTISTIVRVLNALGLTASFSIGNLAPVTLENNA